MADNKSGNGKKQTLLGSVLTLAVLIVISAARLLYPGSDVPGAGDASEASLVEVSGSALESPALSESYSFRNERLLNQHYEKHGIEMGFDTVEEYVAAANAVINHPDALHKLEAEDNDDIYFLEATNEFVVVSTDGYIRTYFIAGDGIDYYNRQ